MPTNVVIVGAGTLGAIIYDCMVDDERWNPVGFIDDAKAGTRFFGLDVGRTSDYRAGTGIRAVMAVGAPTRRRAFVQALSPLGFEWASFLDRRSHVSGSASIGTGTVVLPFATVGPMSRIGDFGYLGSYTAVGGGATLGGYASLMPRASVGGGSIGECCQIGFNSACLNDAILGDEVAVMPYTWVRKPVPSNTMVTGNPARYRRLR